LVVGGGDSAVDWALLLSQHAREVTLIHRRDRFRAHEGSVAKLRAAPVRLLTPYQLRDINPDGTGAWLAEIFRSDDPDHVETLAVDAVVIAIGFVSSLGALRDWGLELAGDSIVVNRRMETNLPGVYAIGDVATYPGKLKLIVAGFSEATLAVSNAKLYIDPESRLQPAHSSTVRRQ